MNVEGVSETVLSREWFNQVFDSISFPKYISYHDDQFFENVFKLMEIP